jgi:hypothetical protein
MTSESWCWYPAEQCDVRPDTRATLTQYRVKRQEWSQLLDGDPEHSIHLQIGGMMWADAAYRAIDEARRFSAEENPTSAAAPMVAELLDQGYVASTVLSIGKLTDAEASNLNKGVISLRSILEDMGRNKHLLTRELFVCHDGRPFDPVASAADYYRRNPIVSGKPTWLGTCPSGAGLRRRFTDNARNLPPSRPSSAGPGRS